MVSRETPRPRVWWGGQLACAAGLLLLVAVALVIHGWRKSQPEFSVNLETGRGERKRVSLPDGSVIEINVSSRGTAAYYDDLRTVTLTAGEMLFTVHPDSARPFTVDAGSGRITVVGTRFNAFRDGAEVSVSVGDGTVELSGAVDVEPVRLTAGFAASVDERGRIENPQRIDIAAVGAWREGKLVFDGATLAEVVREVMRYREKPIRIADSRISQLRLSSIFSANDTDALLSALPKILPVRVATLPDGSVEIRGR
jgi:transmembrane sensor